MESQPLTLVCLSHLNWNHVWQRPQQLMSRFARQCRVLYFDPPQIVTGADDPEFPAGTRVGASDAGQARPYLIELPSETDVRVFRPIFPHQLLDTPGNSYPEMWLRLLPEALALGGQNSMMWVFSPLADYLVAAVRPQVKLAIYDCMDDLASFRGGTQDMRQRENNLLDLVDLLFTGGYSMYEARKDRHSRAFCFPSGVDLDHYRQVGDAGLAEHARIAAIPHPRLGYFGVLDERIDWELIATVAARRPDWHWTLVGPTAKIEPADLPVAPNIHYFGQQPYAQLPAFLKGFDVATMPFALNEATRYISPTKTLEYLAGGKPVISSSVPDVVAFYSEIVYLADGADAWIATLDELLAGGQAEWQARRARAQPILEQSSWDSIAERMWALMQEQLARPSAGQGGPDAR